MKKDSKAILDKPVTATELTKVLEQYPTKTDLAEALKPYVTKNDMIGFKDEILHEIKGLREENIILTGDKVEKAVFPD